MDGTPTAISLRAVVTAAVALAALLAAGVLTLGLGGGEPAAAQAPAAGGCVAGTFAYDAVEQRRQARFEAALAEGASLPAFGFHADAQDSTATLHAASHSYVVVYYRPGAATAALKRLAADAVARKIPLVASPRRQDAALVAITQDRELTCAGAQVDAIRSFASATYPGLAQ